MIHCTLICDLVDELCPESATVSPLAMKWVHMSSSVEILMVQTAEVKRDKSHTCLGGEAGLGMANVELELEEEVLGKRQSISCGREREEN